MSHNISIIVTPSPADAEGKAIAHDVTISILDLVKSEPGLREHSYKVRAGGGLSLGMSEKAGEEVEGDYNREQTYEALEALIELATERALTDEERGEMKRLRMLARQVPPVADQTPNAIQEKLQNSGVSGACYSTPLYDKTALGTLTAACRAMPDFGQVIDYSPKSDLAGLFGDAPNKILVHADLGDNGDNGIYVTIARSGSKSRWKLTDTPTA